MENNLSLQLQSGLVAKTVDALHSCNNLTARYGLTLSAAQITALAQGRLETLRSTARVEFGEGILPKLIYTFCDSPYLTQDNYADTVYELQEIFYHFKNESEDRFSDDELLEFMRRFFDGRCEGSLDYLSGTSLEDLSRSARYDYETGVLEDHRPLFLGEDED